ncbi:MAG: hypothetical protein ABSG53_18440 [Thermoguttaceae bacterium]|jgi:hypothetical protein
MCQQKRLGTLAKERILRFTALGFNREMRQGKKPASQANGQNVSGTAGQSPKGPCAENEAPV